MKDRKEILHRLLALKRYDAGAGYDLYTYGDENEEGNWVKWEDIEEIVNELAQEAQELEHCHD